MEQPLVSVITITRNRGNLISRCIRSVLEQTYTNVEYIVVDGASTDSTDDVVNSFDDNRFIYIKLDENLDIKTTLDIGIARAKGEYITFLDSDDEYVPEKIAKQVSFFESRKDECGFIYCWMTYFDEKTHKILRVHAPKLRGYVLEEAISKRTISGTPTLMFKADVLRDLDGWKSPDEIGIISDWELCARACQKYKVDYLPESLVNVYINHGSLRQSNLAYYNNFYEKNIKFHKYFLEAFSEVFEKNPKLATYHYYMLCRFSAKLGERRNAWIYFNNYMRTSPNFIDSIKAIFLIILGK